MVYDRDKLYFDPTSIKKELPPGTAFASRPYESKEWAYLTISDHPLDDIHPLGFYTPTQQSLMMQGP